MLTKSLITIFSFVSLFSSYSMEITEGKITKLLCRPLVKEVENTILCAFYVDSQEGKVVLISDLFTFQENYSPITLDEENYTKNFTYLINSKIRFNKRFLKQSEKNDIELFKTPGINSSFYSFYESAAGILIQNKNVFTYIDYETFLASLNVMAIDPIFRLKRPMSVFQYLNFYKDLFPVRNRKHPSIKDVCYQGSEEETTRLINSTSFDLV
jgi:hypothetical protein